MGFIMNLAVASTVIFLLMASSMMVSLFAYSQARVQELEFEGEDW